jgi:LCP family protein required for cell wall assembly
MEKKKNNKSNFFKYIGILQIIVSILLALLVYYLNIFPLEYFIVFSIILVIIDALTYVVLLSKKPVFKFGGIILSLAFIVLMIVGINYEFNTIGFLKNFTAFSYKTETYNVLVLTESDYNEIKDLKNKKIGHFDESDNTGLKEALNVISKKANYIDTVLNDNDDYLKKLDNKKIDAVVLEEAIINILNEENTDFSKYKVIDTIEVDVKVENKSNDLDVTKESFNVYISGIDTYGKITKTSRSDVNIIATVNPLEKEILLTNIPRDYYVKLSNIDEYDKLTHAAIYGIDTSIGTIEDLLDINIDYYLKVNFTSLESIVDTLGGITINSNYSFTSQDGYKFVLGKNTLNGKEALSFARERKSFKEGDRVRGENQQIILTALIEKVISPKIISNYTALLKDLDGKFLTNMTDQGITSLIRMQLNDMKSWNITSISLDGSDSYQYTYSYKKNKLYVMEPDMDTVIAAQDKIKEIME